MKSQSAISQIIASSDDLILPPEVEKIFLVPEPTQAVWRCTNRYGWRDMTIKIGRRVAYHRSDIEHWLESRRGLVKLEK